MAKKSRKSVISQSNEIAKPGDITLSTLSQDSALWYRVRVLLHDLSNVGSDSSSEKRLSSTTHELYISAPYFTESEAIKVRTTLCDNNAEASMTADASVSSSTDSSLVCETVTLEEAIHGRLADFFDKRRASGDARPCGPHDMFPIYASFFGIEKEELKDELFVARLRRSGLGDSRFQQGEVCMKGQKKGGNGKRS